MRRFVQALTFTDPPLAGLVQSCGKFLERANYNIGKGDSALVLRADAKVPMVEEMRWGLVPSWSKQPETKYTTVTARLDRASRSRIFRNAWRERHCIIPMTGYYKLDRTTKPATPHFIHDRDGGMLLVAGLWEEWDKGDVPLHSFTILTHPTDAIPPPLTPDGPLFLTQPAAKRWLHRSGWLAGALVRTAAQPKLVSYAVSSAYRDRTRNDYTLLEPRSASEYLLPSIDYTDDEDEDGDEDEDEDE